MFGRTIKQRRTEGKKTRMLKLQVVQVKYIFNKYINKYIFQAI